MQKKKNKKDLAQELVYGIHPILELLKAKKRKLYTIYTTSPEPKAWPQILKLLPKSVQIQKASRDILDRIAQTKDHQSIVAWASPYKYTSKFFGSKKQPLLVMLNEIQDARNLGAILRTSYCTGVDGVIITTRNSATLTAATLKASAGLAEHLLIYQVSTGIKAVQELKQAGYKIYFTTLAGENITQIKLEFPSCMVIGNEAAGIPKNLASQGIQVKLPQAEPDISYNASVAAGIILFIAATNCGKI